ncbi:LLM class flavin-dependent oxidoreductase [Pseudonocardia sp. NPDC049154]|uniref:LLM class flavin-dependent oxidoreductase n=1 Tax=Pseudonocardia sp. NPDC049154 TaxID=3155501 RepID=UPI00340246BA
MSTGLPAVALIAAPGRIAETVALGADLDAAGFAGLYLPSTSEPMSLCLSLAHATRRIALATSVLPIYRRHPTDLAAATRHLAEVSEGRFRLGLGVSHAPQRERLGVRSTSLLGDLRTYLDELDAELKCAAPVVVAALGPRMTELALARDGLVQANVGRAATAVLVESLRDRRPPAFEVSTMIPTVVGADLEAARERCRDILTSYVTRPNYVAQWRRVGHGAVMDAIETAGDPAVRRAAMTDAWIDDVCLLGPLDRIRDGLTAWSETGVDLPILVPSALDGGHRTAVRHVLGLAG